MSKQLFFSFFFYTRHMASNIHLFHATHKQWRGETTKNYTTHSITYNTPFTLNDKYNIKLFFAQTFNTVYTHAHGHSRICSHTHTECYTTHRVKINTNVRTKHCNLLRRIHLPTLLKFLDSRKNM